MKMRNSVPQKHGFELDISKEEKPELHGVNESLDIETLDEPDTPKDQYLSKKMVKEMTAQST